MRPGLRPESVVPGGQLRGSIRVSSGPVPPTLVRTSMTPARALNAFLHRYLEDGSTGTRRSLEAYQALFPGHEELIAEQYGVLDSPGDPSIGRKGTLDRVGPYRILRRDRPRRTGSRLSRRGRAAPPEGRAQVLTGLGSLAPDRVARFLREAEVASRLDHPGIATVYETGTEGGVPYIAMRYVEGETLAKRIEASESRRTIVGAGSAASHRSSRRPRAPCTPRTRPESSTATSSPGT